MKSHQTVSKGRSRVNIRITRKDKEIFVAVSLKLLFWYFVTFYRTLSVTTIFKRKKIIEIEFLNYFVRMFFGHFVTVL